MDLLIDGCPLQTPARDRGIGRYTSGLLAALRMARPDWTMCVIEHARLPAIPDELLGGIPTISFAAPLAYDLSVPANFAVNDYYFADWIASKNPEHVLFASAFEKLGVVPRFGRNRPRTSAVMYDLIPLIFPGHYNPPEGVEPWYAQRFRDICAMDQLFAISGAATDDARRLIGPAGPEVRNIRGAVDARFLPTEADGDRELGRRDRTKFGIEREFILYVGGDDYRKNLSGAIEGFAALPDGIRNGIQLVIACNLSENRLAEIAETSRRRGLTGQVIATGFVGDDELVRLYRQCRLFFFPSRYEGLGLPVLEALTVGAPVVCSNTSSLPEFAGDVSWLCDPDDPRSMAAALRGCLDEPRDRRRGEREDFARTFTWSKTAETVAESIERPARPRRGVGRRLAWIAGLASERTESLREFLPVIDRLARDWSIELVLADRTLRAAMSPRYPSLAPDDFPARASAAPFDLAVMEVDTVHPATGAIALAVRHSCAVIFNPEKMPEVPGPGLHRLLGAAAAVIVTSPGVRAWVRSWTDAPVIVIPELGSPKDGRRAASWLRAALECICESISRRDRPWIDGVANALEKLAGPIAPEIATEWSRLRRGAGLPAVPVPEVAAA